MSQLILSDNTLSDQSSKDRNTHSSISPDDFIPALDKSFPSFQEVEIFLDYFSRFNNFSVVLLRSQKIFDIVMQATFGCYKSGKYRCRSSSSTQSAGTCKLNMHSQKSVKTDCPWRVNVRYSTRASKFIITKVVLEHNHPLSPSSLLSSRIILNRGDPLVTRNIPALTSLSLEKSNRTLSNNYSSPSSEPTRLVLNKKPRRSRNKPFQTNVENAEVYFSINPLTSPSSTLGETTSVSTFHENLYSDHLIISGDEISFPYTFSFDDQTDLENISQAITCDLSSMLKYSMASVKGADP